MPPTRSSVGSVLPSRGGGGGAVGRAAVRTSIGLPSMIWRSCSASRTSYSSRASATRGWQKPPTITPYDETILVPGMTLAIEQHVSKPGVGTVRFEETVLVTNAEPEIMTAGSPARWW